MTKRTARCPHCKGLKQVPCKNGRTMTICPACNGAGSIKKEE